MKPGEFRDLVEKGALPGPIQIGPHERYSVRQIDAVLSGAAMQEEFEW